MARPGLCCHSSTGINRMQPSLLQNKAIPCSAFNGGLLCVGSFATLDWDNSSTTSPQLSANPCCLHRHHTTHDVKALRNQAQPHGRWSGSCITINMSCCAKATHCQWPAAAAKSEHSPFARAQGAPAHSQAAIGPPLHPCPVFTPH